MKKAHVNCFSLNNSVDKYDSDFPAIFNLDQLSKHEASYGKDLMAINWVGLEQNQPQ